MPCSTRSMLGPFAITFVLASLIAPQSPLAAQQPTAPAGAYAASPYLGEIRNNVLYGDIWERPQLSARDRSLITVAVTQALYATNELRIHIGRALDNGVTQSEIGELIGHVLWYSGFPTAVNAARVADIVQRKVKEPVEIRVVEHGVARIAEGPTRLHLHRPVEVVQTSLVLGGQGRVFGHRFHALIITSNPRAYAVGSPASSGTAKPPKTLRRWKASSCPSGRK